MKIHSLSGSSLGVLRVILVMHLLFSFFSYVMYPQPPGNQTETDSIITIEAVKAEAYHISSQLRTLPGSISILTSGGISVSDGTNLTDAINALPGANMQTGTYTTNRIVIRGMGSRTPYNTNRIRTYLNDIPLTASDGLSSPEEIDAENLGRLELIKGPSSALYGSGLGGSINLYTPVVDQTRANIKIQYGSFNTWKTNLEYQMKSGNTALWSNISHLRSGGYRENSEYKRTSLLLDPVWEKSAWKINYLLLIVGVDSELPSSVGKSVFEEDPGSAASNWLAVKGYKKYVRGITGLTVTNRISDKVSHKLILFARGIDSYEKRPFNNLDDRSFSGGLRNKLMLHYPKTDWVFGSEWIAEKYEWQLDTSEVLINRNHENRSLVNIFGLVYFHPFPKINISFATALNYIRYRLTDRFAADGLRDGKREFPVMVSPRIGINYAPNPALALYASAGHGFSLPSPEETLLPAGDINPEIEPEQGLQVEIGSRLNLLNNTFNLDGTLYWIELSNLLVTKRVTEDIFTGINAGRTRHRGFEIMVHGKILRNQEFPGNLSADLSFTRSRNHFIRFNDNGTDYDGKLLPIIPDMTFYSQLEWEIFKMLKININARYTGNQFLNDANTMKYDKYWVSNVKISGLFSAKSGVKLNIFGGINNVGNTLYASMLIANAIGFSGSEPRYYYPGLPRNFYAGMKFTF